MDVTPFEEGLSAARFGVHSNPYTPGTPSHDEWWKGQDAYFIASADDEDVYYSGQE